MTPAGTKKIARIRHDPRASFLVESGERYTDLRGVHFTGRVDIVEDATAMSRIEAAVNAKYAAFRPPAASLPAAAQTYYASQVFLRFVPDGRILTWDNARLADERVIAKSLMRHGFCRQPGADIDPTE